MKTKLQFVLTALSFVGLLSSIALADEKASAAPSAPSTETTKPAPVQALDKAHEAAGAASSRDEDIAKQASTITDDEGMADEDMEMPEEDLDDAPAGSLSDE